MGISNITFKKFFFETDIISCKFFVEVLLQLENSSIIKTA